MAEVTAKRPSGAQAAGGGFWATLFRADAGADVAGAKRGAIAGAVSPEQDLAATVAAQTNPTGDAQFQCLAQAVYFEARGESLAGQAAVAEVVLNRVESPKFPKSICGVVHQGSAKGCQFSWTCDGRKDAVGRGPAWERSKQVARALMDGAPRALTKGATHFHTPAVKPAWAKRFVRTAKIGAHIFYRQPVRTASN